MKNFKRILVAVIGVVCVVAMLFAFTACTDNGNDLEKTITIVIGEGEDQVVYADYTTNARYLFDVLNELANAEENPLVLEGTYSSYGMYVTALGDLAPEGNEWISLLISDVDNQDITEWAVTKSYNGTDVVTSNLGVSSLPLKDGAVYMFVILTY